MTLTIDVLGKRLRMRLLPEQVPALCNALRRERSYLARNATILIEDDAGITHIICRRGLRPAHATPVIICADTGEQLL